MGKKSRSKTVSERKERQRKAVETATRIHKAISTANSEQDLLATFDAFCSMDVKLQPLSSTSLCAKDSRVKLKIEFHASPISKELLTSCLKLFQENMADLYRSSNWGLNMKEKERELQHDNARFLIVKVEGTNDYDSIHDKNVNSDGMGSDIVGFTHFRFEPDDEDHPNEEVLYVYELQIHEFARRVGLGKRLMSIMELIGLQMRMKKVMLTVFKANQVAMDFYLKKIKYTIDESSPSQFNQESVVGFGQEEVDYEILSKRIHRG